MAALREVLAHFGVKFDSSEIDKGNKSVEDGISKLRAFGAVIASSAVVGGAIAFAKHIAAEIDPLAKQASALGISTAALQGWHHAANLSGLQAGVLDVAMGKIQKKAFDAANGNKMLAKAFDTLGVSVENADGSLKSADQLFGDVADGLSKLENRSEQTALSMLFFEESGGKFLNLFAAGADGIAKMRGEVEDLGASISDDFAKSAELMNDNLARMDLATFGLKIRLGNFLIPIVSRVAVVASKAIAEFGKWTDRAKAFVVQSNVMQSALAWLGGAGLLHVLKLVGGFRGLWAMLGRVGLMLRRFAARILLPILLLDDLISTFQGGDTLIRRAIDSMFGDGTTQQIVDWFQGAYTSGKEFLGKIVEAFKADGVDRIKQLFPGLSDAWANRLFEMKSALTTVLDFIGASWEEKTEYLAAMWQVLSGALAGVAEDIGAFFVGSAASVASAFQGAWNAIIDGAQRVLKVIDKVIDALPGARTVANAFGVTDAFDAVDQGLDGARAGDARANFDRDRAQVQRARDAQTERDIVRFERAEQRISNQNVRGGDVNVNVTVPPGTPGDMARSVGNAAATAVGRSNRANLAAVQRVAGS